MSKGLKREGFRAGAPILGLILAIALAAVAFGISVPLVKYLEGEYPDIENQFVDLRNNFDADDPMHDYIVEIVIAGLLWFVLLGFAMFIASAAMGTNPEKEVWKDMPPSPANKKGTIKMMKKDLREAKKAAKAQKRQRKG